MLDDGQSFHARRAPAQHASLPRHHLRLVSGAYTPRAHVALRHTQPALRVKHLFIGASRCTDAKLLSVL